MNSLITSIRSAVRPGSLPDSLVENEPDAQASSEQRPLVEASTTGADMSASQTASGAANADAGTFAAIAAAASGGSDGYKAAMDRIDAIFSADGIKGDAKRMSAAHDLAKASPDMTAESVVAFVTANVPQAGNQTSQQDAAGTQASASYEQRRSAAADLAMPQPVQRAGAAPKISSSDIYSMRRNANKEA